MIWIASLTQSSITLAIASVTQFSMGLFFEHGMLAPALGLCLILPSV